MESRELWDFVRALESRRGSDRARAIAALGVTERKAPSEFAAPGASQLGQVYEHDGKRFVIAAQLASAAPPVLPLAVQGTRLRMFEERPSAHAVPVLVCGERACPSSSMPVLPARRALGVELAPGEELGAPLPLRYDYWWAQVSYDRRRSCPPQPTQARAE